MKLKYSVVILSLLAVQAYGQINKYGSAVSVNYPPGLTQGTEQNWAITEDNRGVLYVGNDEKGILEYDGFSWRNIPVANNSTVRSLATSDDGTVYVGAVAEIGYLAPNINGDLHYVSLLPLIDTAQSEFTNVWKTYTYENKVFFCAKNYIYEFNQTTRDISVYNTFDHTLFSFLENGKLYCSGFIEGLGIIEHDSLVHAIGGHYYKSKNIYALTTYDEDHLLISCGDFGFSLYNTITGAVDADFAPKETNKYLNDNLLYHIIKLENGDFFGSTVYGGAVIIDHRGRIKEILSKAEGLQDQTFFHSYVSNNSYPYTQVWSALSIGIVKTNIVNPFRKFVEKSGFHGLINSVLSIDDKIFIGTLTGLFSIEIENGKTKFSKEEGINSPVWGMTNYTLANGEKVILAISHDGLFEARKNGSPKLLDDLILDISDPTGKKLVGYSIYTDPDDPNRVFLGRASSILSLENINGRWHEYRDLPSLDDEVRTMAMDNEGYLWYGTKLAGIGRVDPNDKTSREKKYSMANGLPSMDENSVFRMGDQFVIGTINGFYNYDYKTDSIVINTELNQYLPKGKNKIFKVYKDQDDCIWMSFENSKLGWTVAYLQPEENNKYKLVIKPFLTLPNFSSDAFFSNSKGEMWFSNSTELYHFDKSVPFIQGDYQAIIRRVTIGKDSVIFNGAIPKKLNDSTLVIGEKQDEGLIPHIKHVDNNVEFRWSSPYFEQEEKLEFSFFLEGFSKDWSEWEAVQYQDFTNLPHGNYKFSIKAKNIYNDVSNVESYSFIILRPWHLTLIAFLLYFIAAIILIYVIIALYTKRLKNENIRLEGIIGERTAEITKQKEELTDSIEYASRIQRALLPPDHLLAQHDINHFILFRPRDIVSGDFYWFGVNKGKIFIVAADCTGHGVPGAFMSMLGISFLDEIVNKSGVTDTNKILDALKEHVITSLRQTGKSMDESTKDGMDLAMIAINEKSQSVQFSGAYNPLYVVRQLNKDEKETLAKGDELTLERGAAHNDSHLLSQVRADQMPIGISEKDFEFTAKEISEEAATYYLFSDGYVDQFGGPSGKKLMSRNFKKMLLEIQDLSMEEQHDWLNRKLIEWMGDIEQIDDVLVIGVKIGI